MIQATFTESIKEIYANNYNKHTKLKQPKLELIVSCMNLSQIGNNIWKDLPWMKAIFDNFLAIFSPLVTIIKHIHITPCLKAESGFSKLSPHFQLVLLWGWAPPPTKNSNPQAFCFGEYWDKRKNEAVIILIKIDLSMDRWIWALMCIKTFMRAS